jgi:oligo-alginate lyase
MRRESYLVCFLILLSSALSIRGQGPSLFMTETDFDVRKQIAVRETWAAKSLALLLKEADSFPGSYSKRFGLDDSAPPPEGGQWLHWYACPESGRALEFHPPDQNVCPDTGKNFSGYPYDHVVYQLRNDALAEAAVAEGLAFRFSGQKIYAEKAAAILKEYAHVYPSYALHDINGKTGPNGGKAFAQTLDESIWLIKIAWAYDLARGAGALTEVEKRDIETNVLRASAAVVMKAHKEPTLNIQSWINSAVAAVGFTLNDEALVHEAIDGPIGFRYQMKTFVQEGFWSEGAWGYQFYAMRALTMLGQMASRHGINLWKQEPNLIALFHSPLGVVLPDGKLPAFNDSGSPDLYEQDFLYEVAYAATRDPTMLTVIEHGTRSDREAFLFGVEHLPATSAPKLASGLFADAGYATLRASRSDLTVVMKFGPHGGAHGHYDKLNFVLFAKGKTLAIDPGTHPYGIPVHREWDSQTIAHNTISVDEQRQAAATGKLLGWKSGDGWTAVSASSGSAYTSANLRRTILLTSEYVLVLDHCDSADGKPHTFDWAYHNVGEGTLSDGLKTTPFHFDAANGYQRLSNVTAGKTSDAIRIRYHSAEVVTSKRAVGESNSTPSTYRSEQERADHSPASGAVDVELQMLPAANSDVFTGNSPSRDTPPVSFVIVRRKGLSFAFATLLQASARSNTPPLAIESSSHGYIVRGIGFEDEFSDELGLVFRRRKR